MALHDHEHVLVFLRWGIGDLLLQWPALERLRASLSHGRLTLVGAKPAVQLLEGSAIADRVRGYQEFDVGHLGGDSPAGLRRLGEWLDAESFDALADVLSAPQALRTVVWGKEGGRYYESDRKTMRAALAAGAGASRALTAGAEAGWGLPALDAIDPPEVPAGGVYPTHLPGRDAEEEADALWGQPGNDVERVAIVPFASHPLKRWPEARFRELAGHLLQAGREVVLFAAPSEPSAARIHRYFASTGGVQLVPPQPLRVTAALLRRAGLTVGNDTGLLHLSSAMGTPAVSIFGPSDGQVYAPGGRSDLALQPELPCQYRQHRSLASPGCWTSSRCLIRDRSCIEEIPVEQVAGRVERVLAAAS